MNAKWIVISFVFLALVSGTFAQTQGEITGQVADTTGGLIAAAKITVTNEGTNAVRSAATNHAAFMTCHR